MIFFLSTYGKKIIWFLTFIIMTYSIELNNSHILPLTERTGVPMGLPYSYPRPPPIGAPFLSNNSNSDKKELINTL